MYNEVKKSDLITIVLMKEDLIESDDAQTEESQEITEVYKKEMKIVQKDQVSGESVEEEKKVHVSEETISYQ